MTAVAPLPSLLPGAIRTLSVLRHGTSEWNRTGRVSGQGNPGLSAEGRAMAERLKRLPGRERIDTIVCSTLRRSIETAEPLAAELGVPLRQEPDLCEQRLGIAEGRFRDDRDPQIAAAWRQREHDRVHFRVPGGETFAEVYERVVRLLTGTIARDCGRHVLLVGHRNSVRAVLGYLLGWSLAEAASAKIRTKYLYEIDLEGPAVVRSILLREDRYGEIRAGLLL